MVVACVKYRKTRGNHADSDAGCWIVRLGGFGSDVSSKAPLSYFRRPGLRRLLFERVLEVVYKGFYTK